MIEKVRGRMMAEVEKMRHELEHELPKIIAIARAHGDLRENADYTSALERRDFLQARMGHLIQRMSQMQNVKPEDIPEGKVGLGSTITIHDLTDDVEETLEIVISNDERKPGCITLASPIGRALKDRVAGEEVTVALPFGERKLKLLKLVTIHEK